MSLNNNSMYKLHNCFEVVGSACSRSCTSSSVIKNIEHQVHKSNIKISGCKQTVRGSTQINQFLKMLINRFIRDESIIKIVKKIIQHEEA
mgnify:CR=1 FL=1